MRSRNRGEHSLSVPGMRSDVQDMFDDERNDFEPHAQASSRETDGHRRCCVLLELRVLRALCVLPVLCVLGVVLMCGVFAQMSRS
jgi:hypothetical protein